MAHLVKNTKYTLDFLLSEEGASAMEDMPCLMVNINNHMYPIQQSHMTNEQMLSIEGFGNTKWEYKGTTHEWVPVFHGVSPDLVNFIDFTLVTDHNDDEVYWVTPKGFPRDYNE